MTEQTGPAADAATARRAALAARHDSVAEADRALIEALTAAHAATVEGIARLDAIQQEIDEAVARQIELAVDTPAGGLNFQRFLLAKQREISAIISQARQQDADQRARLESLSSEYALAVRNA